jgi:hypothetical protein
MMMFLIRTLRAYPQLPHLQVRTAYGKKKLVTVWVIKTGQQRQVDIRDAGKKKYSRTPILYMKSSNPSVQQKRCENVQPLDVRMSKTISWLLRHGAKSESIDMRPDGYVRVSDLVRRILGASSWNRHSFRLACSPETEKS